MTELVGGENGAVACGELLRSFGWQRFGFVSGDGEAKVWAASFEIERGSYYQPCSARKRARISKARWRAAWASWAAPGAPGRTGVGGVLGAYSRPRLILRSSSKRSNCRRLESFKAPTLRRPSRISRCR